MSEMSSVGLMVIMFLLVLLLIGGLGYALAGHARDASR